MSRLLAAKRLLAILLLSFILPSTAANALEMDLMQGEIKKGSVSFLARGDFKYAALDQVLTRLGFAPTQVSGGLTSTFSGKKIEFWNGSNVVRVNGTVFPLPAVIFFEDGHWWGEASASLNAVAQFLESVSRPSDIGWSSKGEAARRNDSDIPVAPKLGQAAKQQPSPSAGASSGAVISRVRWGEQADAYRAVIDISAQADADVQEHPGRVDISFRGANVNQFTNGSPWSPLSVEARQSSGNAVLSFKHSASRVKSFWLRDPPRYVVDFYFSGSAAVTPEVAGTPREEPPPAAGAGAITTTPAQRFPAGGGKQYIVVVDAGHGGQDPGAVGNGLKEKDINLKAALELAASLRNLGLTVKLTRTDDRYLKLAERTAFANNERADVFISLHCNALPKGQHASGVELYLMDQPTDRAAFNLAVLENKESSGEPQSSAEENAASDKRTNLLLKILIDMQQNDKINESTNLAEFLYEKTRKEGFSLRKVRQAPFFVLRGAEMPALLIEMGYITEAKDSKQLNSQAYRKKMMNSIATGILHYLKSRQEGGGG